MNYDKLTKEQLIGLLKDTEEYIQKQQKIIEEIKEEMKQINQVDFNEYNLCVFVSHINGILKRRINND